MSIFKDSSNVVSVSSDIKVKVYLLVYYIKLKYPLLTFNNKKYDSKN